MSERQHDMPVSEPRPAVETSLGSTRSDVVDSGILCLSVLLRALGVAQAPEQIRHAMALGDRAATADDLLRFLTKRGFKTGQRGVQRDSLTKAALPAIAPCVGGGFLVVGQISEENVVAYSPLQRKTITMSRLEFEALWDGTLILATRRVPLLGEGGHFDISWFVPAVFRFKGAFSEIFAASFFLQLLGLIGPLFFQVVVDKVLAHQSLTTLDVLIIGLVLVSVFEVILGFMRTHLFAHTTNRIDVILGSKLFHHMQHLPLDYFQSRRVGETVARMRELETIRSFLTDSALTLVIDTFFGLVFILVMFWYSTFLSLVVIASFPLFIGLSLLVTPVLQHRIKEQFARAAENQSFLVETVSSIETVKAMAVEPQMQRRWEDQLSAYVHASFKAASLNNVAGQTAQLINKGVIAATL